MSDNCKTQYLLYFARHDNMAWLAHLDMMRFFERALRRAGLPLLWSKGFNPRIEMVFALPLGMGLECAADLLEIELSEPLLESEIMRKLNDNLPLTVRIVKVERLEPHSDSYMSLVKAAEYTITAEQVGTAFATLFADSSDLSVQRLHKGKLRNFSLREYVLSYEICTANCLLFQCLAGSSKNLRPELILKLLHERGLMSADAIADAVICRRRLILADKGACP